MTKVVLPAFSGENFEPFEMRQLVSALELRFQSLESAGESLFDIDSGSELDDRYSLIGHVHSESEITDLSPYLLNITGESIFDLADVSGTPSINQVLQWNGAAFVPTSPSATAIALGDLSDVSVVAPIDGEVLTYVAGNSRWEPAGSGAGITSFAALTDTDLSAQAQYDLVFNANGSEWQDTAGSLQWNPTFKYLQLANEHSINWRDGSFTSVELLTLEHTTAVSGDPQWAEVQLVAEFNGADAATTYTEVSDNAAIATFVANAELDTAQFNFGTSSLLLDGTGDYVSFPDIDAYDLAPSGAQDWTIEGFVRFNSLLSNPETREFAGQDGAWQMEFTADGFSTQRIHVLVDGNIETATINNTTIATGAWYHYLMTRIGNNLYVGFNGFREFSGIGLFAGAQATSANPITIGSTDAATANDMWDGWVDDVRITIGTSRYDLTQATYTVPTSYTIGGDVAGIDDFVVGDPGYATRVDGTLVGLDNDVGINWENSAGDDIEHLVFTETTPGGAPPADPDIGSVTFLASLEGNTVGLESFTPETGPAMEWWLGGGTQPTQVDGEVSNTLAKFGTKSIYWKEDGGATFAGWQSTAGTAVGNFAANDFTIEFDIHIVATMNTVHAMGKRPGTPDNQWYILFGAGSGNLTLAISTTGSNEIIPISQHRWAAQGGNGIQVDTWHTVAICRSGSSWYAFLDGELSNEGVQTDSSTIYTPGTNQKFAIGQDGGDLGSSAIEGYMDNVRITEGVARYTANYTPSTTAYDGSSGSQAFVVGDPAYDTQIDGLTTTITSAETIIDGDVTHKVKLIPQLHGTHTGEVTGEEGLTLDVTSITNRTDVVADSADDAVIHDDSDGLIKKVNLSSITDAGYF